MARRGALDRPALVVGALFAVSAALTAYFATQITTFQPDELGYTHMAIALGDSPGLWTTEFGGGDRLNQLYPLVLAPIYRLFGNVDAYHVAHWFNALLMASTVVPVYLLARGVLERRWAAYMAAAVAAIVPWVTVSAGELTEVIAYPAGAWALFAMHRAVTRPSWRADLWALGAIVVAAYARLQLGILGPIFIAAVVVHELGWALSGSAAAAAGGRGTALREARRRLLRDHRVLAGVTGAGLVAFLGLLAAGKLQAAFGYYGNTVRGELFPPGMWSNARANVTFLAWGVGVLPMAFTVGLVLENTIAPRERRVHAFAVLAILTFLAIVLSVARINVSLLGDEVQERYVMFVVPLLFVGLLAGLLETRRPAAVLLLGASVVVALMATTDFAVAPSSFWFLVSPGMAWFIEIVGPQLAAVGDRLGSDAASPLELGAWATGLGCIGLAVAIRAAGRRRAVVAGAVTGIVLVFCVTATVHSLNRVVNGSNEYRGLGEGDLRGADWIDAVVGDATPVALLASQVGQVSDSRERWEAAEFWNRAVRSSFVLSTPSTTWHPGRTATVGGDGRIDPVAPGRHVVVATRGVPLGLAGAELARSPDGRLALLDTGGRAWRASWWLEGTSDDGWLPLRRAATLTVRGSRGACREVRLVVAMPAGLAERRTLRVRGAGVAVTARLAPGRSRLIRVPACGPRRLRLRLMASVPAVASAPGATIRLRSVRVDPA